MTTQNEIDKIQDYVSFIFSLEKKYILEPDLILDCQNSRYQLGRIQHKLLVKMEIRKKENKL